MPAAIQDTIHLYIDVDASAAAGVSYVVPRDLTVVDISVVCTAASGGGTMTVSGPGGAISDAIVCAVDTVVTRAGTINDANASLTAGQSITVTSNGAADRGRVIVFCHATSAPALS